MKQLYALLLLQIIIFGGRGVSAGTPLHNPTVANPCDSTPANCVWDLRGNIFDVIYQKTSPQNLIVYGNGTNTDYHDAYFHADAVDFGCTILVDGCSDFSNNYPDTLKIFVYYPKHDYSNTTGCKLPVFIFVHGGGFSDCIGMNRTGELTDACKNMAHKGFVVFSVEYRRGRRRDDQMPMGKFTSVFEEAAIYRAAQDVRGAIRYIIYRQIHHNLYVNEDPYQIDVNNIFLGGNSAGALSVITAAYFYEPSGQAKLNDIFPVVNSNITTVLGAADIDFYLGNDTYNYMQGVRGILSMWGSLFIPAGAKNNPAAYFNSSPYKPPIIAFHGKQDDVFPYIAQPVYYSPNVDAHIPFNSTASCIISGTYALEGNASTVDLYNAGSKGIFDYVLQPLGIFSEVYIDNQMAHGLDDDDAACGNCSSNPFQKYNDAHTSCILCGFQSNFGTPYNNKTDVYNYIIQRAAIFFQAIMTGTQNQVTQTIFIEEQNDRITVCP